MRQINPKSEEVLKCADSLVQKHSELLDELAIWKYRVHSTMFVASATILTLVCSLGKSISGNPDGILFDYPYYSWYLNIAIVLLNGLCLIALLISLSQNIHATDQVKRNVEDRFEQLKSLLTIPRDGVVCVDGEYKIISSVDKSWLFSVCEQVAYISFILMVIGLVFRYCFVQP